MLSLEPGDAGYLSELAEFVAVPSVSRDASAATMSQAAHWLAAQLAFAGGRVVPAGGHPVVRADWLGAPGAPTVLVYGHYDVQPTGDLAEWATPPFELQVRDGVALGRGVSDDKGPVYLVLKTAQAFAAQEGGLPLNVKFLVEGEEEIGSPHLPGYLAEHAAELACDLVISADGAMWRPGEPSLALASKGLVTLDITVAGARTDLHSGRYGGTVANPLHALAQILASLHAPDGSVAVAGFYDGIPELTDERRAQIATVPFDETGFLGALGLREGPGEAGYGILERLWERPTLEINGVSGGGKYTVIPHLAAASVSCRLVPGQDPGAVAAAIAAHVAAEDAALPGVTAQARIDAAKVPAYTIPAGHPAIEAATAALEQVYPGLGVLHANIAGTLPATALFERELGAKTLFFSFSTADENLHAPNEFLRIPRLREGMRAWEALWRLLAAGRLGKGKPPMTEQQTSGSQATGAQPTRPQADGQRAGGRQPARPDGAAVPAATGAYTAYSYLPDGAIPRFELAPEFGRVPPYAAGLAPEQERRAAGLLRDSLVISLHDHPVKFPADMAETPAYNRTGRQHAGYGGLAASGMTVVFDNMMDGTACVTGSAPWRWNDIITDLGMRQADLAHQRGVMTIRTVADIDEAERSGRVGIVFGLEAATPIENEIDRLDVLYGLGLRQIGIAYSDANALGSGLSEPADGGLTAFGHRAVTRMNQLGLAVDLSHSSDRTALDTCAQTTAPVFITHAGARAVWDIARMKPDDVLRAVAQTGGVIGMSAAPHTTLSGAHPRHTIESVMDHFEYIASLVGIEHVAFGPDTFWGDHVALHRIFAHLLSIKAARGPAFEPVAYVDGLENPAENFANICGWLVQHGYSDDDIRAVLGGNIYRALQSIWVSA